MSNKSEDINPEINNTEPQSDLPDQITEYVLTKESSDQPVIVLGRTKKRLEVALIDASAHRSSWFIVAYLDPEVDGNEQTSPDIGKYVRAMPFDTRQEAVKFARNVVSRWREKPPEITSYSGINLAWQVNPNEIIRLAELADSLTR